MTQINYDQMHKPNVNGESMMDRTITIPGIGECVWVNWKKDEDRDISHIEFHCKEDVLNNFNPLLAYNVHPYSSTTDDFLEGGCPDVTCVGNLMRISYRTDNKGAVTIAGFFVHPRFRGKRMSKELLKCAIAVINLYTNVETIVLNPKQHPTSPVPTPVIRKWYKSMGYQELGTVLSGLGLHTCSHKKTYTQYHRKMQRKIRKEGDGLLVMTSGPWNTLKVSQIAGFGLANLLSEWQTHDD
jgi:hypothetical protein